ncbi:MAG TPA: ParB/RepB/Spo0J family partition protein [Opitutaceae bacterium]|jgi:ParB family chromosome partitioning protein|nr:ParB/RepB/Spo0J family partition protein [Opitutaceae bacterium]
MAKSAALGKGLSALMGTPKTLAVPEPSAEKGESIRQVARSAIVPSPLQPRKNFKAEELHELVDSIKERGIIQPLIVRLVNGKYELIAGERRWRAAGEAGLDTLPVIVREASNRDVLELALIENLQRADLNPIEEAEAYARLMKEFSLTQEQVAQQVGKGRVVVANAVRLLALPEQIRAWLGTNDITVGHAKALLGLDTADEQLLAAERVRKENLTVRATERLVETMRAGTRPARKRKVATPGGEAIFADLEKRLQQHVGTRVRITGKADSGKIEIEYFTPADLNRILELLRLPSA